MRQDTKKMLQMLQRGAVDDREAGRKILNPRREAGLIDRRTEYDVDIKSQTDKKREYKLL